jgi:hypothetical protein
LALARQSAVLPKQTERENMLYTIAVVLLVLWLLGLLAGTPIGGFIHLLLAVAIIMVLVNLIAGRKRLN